MSRYDVELMPRGVDPEQFSPKHRTARDAILRLGFVGRVTPEKGVRLLRKIEQALLDSGLRHFRIIVVGEGSEMAWLKRRLKHGEFTGVLRGEELARAHANMNLFVFPSKTDTFGNVVQEAAASGVPAVLTNEGGPRHLVVSGETGYVATQDSEFVAKVVELAHNSELMKQLGNAARERMAGISWDAAFKKKPTPRIVIVCRKRRKNRSFQKRQTWHGLMPTRSDSNSSRSSGSAVGLRRR